MLKKDIKKYVVFLLYAVCFLILLGRSFLSFNPQDEAFYLTSARRLVQGDAILMDEWWVSQFYNVLNEPFLIVFHWFTGGYDGVYLTARIFYLLISFLVSIYLASVLQRRCCCSRVLAWAVAMLYFFYKRENIEGLSYYALCLSWIVLATALLLDEKYVCAGFVLAGAVLCNPYLSIPVLLLPPILFHGKGNIRKAYRMCGGGIAAAAVLYLLWLCHRQGLRETLYIIPRVVQIASGHTVEPPISRIKSWIYLLWTARPWLLLPSLGYILYCRCYYILRKKDLSYRMQLLFFFFQAGVMIYYFVREAMSCGQAHLTLTIGGMLLLLSIRSWQDDYRLPLCMMFCGGVISLCWHLASDTWDAYRIGIAYSSLGAVLMIDRYTVMRKQASNRYVIYERLAGWGKAVLLGSAIFFITVSRIFYIYRDAPFTELDTRISDGPAQGLYTSRENAAYYQKLLDADRQLQEVYEITEADRIYIETENVWEYMVFHARCGAYTTWRTAVGSPVHSLYYETHNYPDYVILTGSRTESVFEMILESDRYEMRELGERRFYRLRDDI